MEQGVCSYRTQDLPEASRNKEKRPHHSFCGGVGGGSWIESREDGDQVAKVRAVVVLGPAGAWRRYHERGAIERRAFNAYYAGAKKAVCLEIGEAKRVDPPVDPHQIIEDFRAPQSFRYLAHR